MKVRALSILEHPKQGLLHHSVFSIYLPQDVREKRTRLAKMSVGLHTAEKYGPWERWNHIALVSGNKPQSTVGIKVAISH